jgi:transglutaminase-like putative cysteine protease
VNDDDAAAISAGDVDPASVDLLDPGGVEWDRVSRSAYLIDQELRYEYEGPIHHLRHRLVVIPPPRHGDQQRVTYRLEVESSSRTTTSVREDVFGNVVVDVQVDRVETSIGFHAVITVLRWPGGGVHRIARELALPDYRRASAFTEPDGALEALARELMASRRSELELAHAINQRVHTVMRYGFGATDVRSTAADALAAGRGVCQDYAHIMLALCRLCGLPARYVSGHLLGEGGTHAWVEVLLPGDDPPGEVVAHAFDPTHGRMCGPGYLTVAVGRDYGDVPPTSGHYSSRFGGVLAARRRVGIVQVEYAA